MLREEFLRDAIKSSSKCAIASSISLNLGPVLLHSGVRHHLDSTVPSGMMSCILFLHLEVVDKRDVGYYCRKGAINKYFCLCETV